MLYNQLLKYAKSTSISSSNIKKQNNVKVESVTTPAMRDCKAMQAGRADFIPAATVGCLTLSRFKKFEHSNFEFVSDFGFRASDL